MSQSTAPLRILVIIAVVGDSTASISSESDIRGGHALYTTPTT